MKLHEKMQRTLHLCNKVHYIACFCIWLFLFFTVKRQFVKRRPTWIHCRRVSQENRKKRTSPLNSRRTQLHYLTLERSSSRRSRLKITRKASSFVTLISYDVVITMHRCMRGGGLVFSNKETLDNFKFASANCNCAYIYLRVLIFFCFLVLSRVCLTYRYIFTSGRLWESNATIESLYNYLYNFRIEITRWAIFVIFFWVASSVHVCKIVFLKLKQRGAKWNIQRARKCGKMRKRRTRKRCKWVHSWDVGARFSGVQNDILGGPDVKVSVYFL